MSFTTISPTYNIPMRRSCRIKASQGLITKDVEPNLDDLFHENMGGSSIPTIDVIYPFFT